jgi:uncharacterized damage-inducible protein DinB
MRALITHVNYDRWANLRLLRASSELGWEAFQVRVGGSFPSLHETFVHLLWAEHLWLERWQGSSIALTLDGGSFPDPESLIAAFERVHTKQLDYLRGLPSFGADQVMTYVNFQGQTWRYPLREMVQHLVIHSAYHRGQAATQLRLLDAVPPQTDYLVYVDTLLQPGSAGQAGWVRTLAPPEG